MLLLRQSNQLMKIKIRNRPRSYKGFEDDFYFCKSGIIKNRVGGFLLNVRDTLFIRTFGE